MATIVYRTAIVMNKMKINTHKKRVTPKNDSFTLWCHQESNRGHKDFQSFALPTELWHQLR